MFNSKPKPPTAPEAPAAPAPTEAPIYLAHSGQTFGPFTQAQIAELKQSGEIFKYTSLWNPQSQQWEPLAPPPPSRQEAPAPEVAAAPARRRNTSLHSDKLDIIDVACHDFRSVVLGRLRNVSERGCELHTEQNTPGPGLATRGGVFLNLLNTKNGKTVNVQAQVGGVKRQPSGWVYRIFWKELPPFP